MQKRLNFNAWAVKKRREGEENWRKIAPLRAGRKLHLAEQQPVPKYHNP
jgi:hypothetical protein